jgi:hypothetical protein
MGPLDQKPLKTAVLSRFNPKTKKLHVYEINLGAYEDNYSVWCKWGYTEPWFRTGGTFKKLTEGPGIYTKQLKWLCTSVIKAMVKYHDYINKCENKGYELVSMS